MKKADRIKSVDNYFHLRKLFREWKSGTSKFFAQRMGISRRSFYRYVKYMIIEDGMKITYDKKSKRYCLEED